METIESKKSNVPLRFEKDCDILTFQLDELPWHLQHHVVRKMEAVDQAIISFLSEEARLMVEKCKLKTKNFEIIIGK